MVLTLTFVLLVSAFALALWGTSLFFQSYLYSEPAGHMPVRALVAGLLVGGVLTLWTLVNTRAESANKYGTFFDFNPVGAKKVTAFEAVRRYPRKKEEAEETVAFQWSDAVQPPAFVDAKGRRYELNNSSFLTVALVIPDGDGPPARFDATLDPKVPNTYARLGDGGNRQFNERGGSRYLDGAYPNTVYAPSRGAVIATLALNGLMFVAWFVAFWVVLQYGSGHALGLAAVCGAATLVVLMPLLFKLNTPKPAAVAGVPVAVAAA